MADSDKHNENAEPTANKVVTDFIASLSNESKMLITLKSQLYGNSWAPMAEDLKNRLTGKPYIFKLASRIQDDIKRIEQLDDFEKTNNIDLSEYVDMP